LIMSKSRSQIKKELVAWRDETAGRSGLEKYKVLSYNALHEIAEKRPRSRGELGAVKGIGPVKLKQYGAHILSIVNGEKKEGDDSVMGGNADVLSVSEFLDQVNSFLVQAIPDVAVRGEVSSFSEHRTGLYFTLTDEDDGSLLHCYMPPFSVKDYGIILEEGIAVKVSGSLNIYKPRGKFTLLASRVEPVGEGSLRKVYEILKQKLAGEGLFERKRPLPEFIGRIGLVTSRDGAAIDDFCRNLAPLGIKIDFFHASVEGARAIREIARAIDYLGKARPEIDVLVVIRGGGSLEDLQAFNSEAVARAVFASRVPTISGIGHERDVPIASLVADKAVSTPTAAAIRINDSWTRLREVLPRQADALEHVFFRQLEQARGRVDSRVEKLSRYFDRLQAAPERIAGELERRLGQIEGNLRNSQARLESDSVGLTQAMAKSLETASLKIRNTEQYLRSVDPERNLRLGYTITTDKQGRILKSAKQAREQDSLITRFSDGEVETATSRRV
jgi:exodeoxyribonuclease VII large subunit